jgi:hypothetical protein
LINKLDGCIEIVCTKMKDTEEPQPFFGKLTSVPLGWFDEDGEEIKGAVFEIEENPPERQEKKGKDQSKNIQDLVSAWFASGSEDQNDSPYISRDGLISYFISSKGLSEGTSKFYAQPGSKGKFIYNLLEAEIIQTHDKGWVVVEAATAASMMMRRSSK